MWHWQVALMSTDRATLIIRAHWSFQRDSSRGEKCRYPAFPCLHVI
ncbi:unnamed protein product, partial [Staurois parvus]